LTFARNDRIIPDNSVEIVRVGNVMIREVAMTVAEEVRAQRKASRRIRKSIGKSPERARRWLIEMGILQRDGKRLARRYR
jgi:vacuolar-type H+-ATPase subunit E/Vma4